MGTYNVNKIEDWYKDFTSVKNKFNNTYYSDYKNSYIRSCSDSVVIRMRNKLNLPLVFPPELGVVFYFLPLFYSVRHYAAGRIEGLFVANQTRAGRGID